MRRKHSSIPAALGILLVLTVSSFPTGASGFGDSAGSAKGCSSCHTLEVAEAADLLKDIVKEVRDVAPAHIPGLFAVSVIGNDGRQGLVYVDVSGKYVISGVAVRIEDRQNISRLEMMDMTRVDTGSLPVEDSLVVGNPKAPKKVFLFTDPLCPFCKKLHPELKRAVQADPGVAFFIKLLPLVSLHPDALRISKTIMCENSLELLEASFAGEKIPDPACDSDVIDRTVTLAKGLGIGSTPTLVLPDGRVAPGFKTAEQILDLLKGEGEGE